MRKREYYGQLRCSHEGCKETANYRFSTQRDYREWAAKQNGEPWLCLAHDDRSLVVTPETPDTTLMETFTAEMSDRLGYCFWNGKTGFQYGNKWRAWSKGFPPGAVVTVETTIRVRLPEATP